MSFFAPIILAAVVLLAAVYAQVLIPQHTASVPAARLTRIGLLVLGLVFGYVAADNFSDAEAPALLTFLIAFGAVHVPAALILFIKHVGGAGKS
jgi:hypothetical protein